MGRAHVVNQFFVEVEKTGEVWSLQIQFDAGYARPEWREDLDRPQPNREWLMELPAAEQKALHDDARRYLQGILSVKGAGANYRYPDLETRPPDFPTLRNGGAYFRMELLVAGPQFEIALSPEAGPTFVFAREGGFDSLKPGKKLKFGDSVPMGVSMERHAVSEGFLHVLPYGLDHTLFILAIFLYARRWRPLLWQSLAFTAAHTLTLGLTISGLIAPPTKWVEPLIVLSIGVLAVENLFAKETVGKKRLALVFFFGLIHGMGFAGALAGTFGGDDFLTRLLLTNLGVELAQITILALAWILTIHFHPRLRQLANLILIAVSLHWFVGFFS